MLSHTTRRRAPFVAAAGVLALAALTGCAGKFGNAPLGSPGDVSLATATPLATTSPAPGATSGASAAPTAPAPAPDPAPPAPAGPADAKGLAVQACETIADGFAAAHVAAAAPLAAQAAAADRQWQPLADELEFIRTHPIDPQTGAGPQQTVDSSTAAAQHCFTLAGVTVSQD
jgi:hypothetical protein